MGFDRRGAEPLEILVVEPKDVVAARLKKELERLGHRVVGRARDGREAVEAAQRLQPNLVLVEATLPGLDGIETARTIVTDEPVPVILLTRYASAELVRRARAAGVVAYLTSVDPKLLVSAIEIALERSGEFRILRIEGSDPSELPVLRRLVEHAKKVLIARLGLSEAEAFQRILERKLDTRRSLRDIARTILGAEEVLARPDFARSLEQIFRTVRRSLKEPRPAESDRITALRRR
jgi:two-component system, response regulator PdtaR